MSPRPRSTTDAHIFAATARAVSRLGPVRLTLAAVAQEAGISPATLVQRFGSKRGLLLAFASHGAGDIGVEMEAIRTARGLAALRALADCMTGLATTPEVLANNLAFLQIDLVDPDFHKLAHEHAVGMRQQIKTMLDEAIEAGEIEPCDTTRLAIAVAAMMNGSLLQWAIDRNGEIRDRIQTDLDTLLRPRLTPRGGRRTRRRPQRSRT